MLDPGNTSAPEQPYLEPDNEEDERSCKICYGADNVGGGKWKCLLRWIESAPYHQQRACNMCRYEYRSYWHLKPLNRWSVPRLNLGIWDVVEILLDMYSTVKLVRNTSAAIQGSKSILGQIFYFMFWKTFIFTDRRIQYYKALSVNMFASVFETSIKNAL
uniref:RING-CH-type domain-containing protein n=1 Tax=Ditylenchus dipsaci TaxID=166011 RepID=A0A915CQI8_9BILA